jgi:hypothetical protein
MMHGQRNVKKLSLFDSLTLRSTKSRPIAVECISHHIVSKNNFRILLLSTPLLLVHTCVFKSVTFLKAVHWNG